MVVRTPLEQVLIIKNSIKEKMSQYNKKYIFVIKNIDTNAFAS